jgi:hypothetical protein
MKFSLDPLTSSSLDRNFLLNALLSCTLHICMFYLQRVYLMLETAEYVVTWAEEILGGGENINRYDYILKSGSSNPSIYVIYLSVCPSVRTSVRPSIRPSIPSIHPSIHLWLYSPFVGLWPLFQFLNPTHRRFDPLDGGSAVARPLPTHRINAHRHPCLEWDSYPQSQCSSEWWQFMP